MEAENVSRTDIVEEEGEDEEEVPLLIVPYIHNGYILEYSFFLYNKFVYTK